MYGIVSQIIDHVYVNTTGDQQYIYFITGALIIIFTVFFIDVLYRAFRHFWR